MIAAQGTQTPASADTLVMTAMPVNPMLNNATLNNATLSTPTLIAPPLPMPTPRQLATSGLRRPRRRTVVALGAAVVLVVGGVVAYEVLKPQPPSASATVQTYFTDLAADDTAAALKLVDPSATSNLSGTLSLLRNAAVLRSPGSRPSGLTVVSSTQESDVYGHSLTVVEVSYKLGASAVRQDIEVASNVTDGSGAKQPFLLENPFLSLQIQDGSGRPLTVNGVAVGSQDVETSVFPGVYTVAMQGDALIAGASKAAAYAPTSAGGTLSVDFSQPTLAPGAEAAVQAQVKSALDTCAQSTSTAPQNCPFSIYPSGADDSVQWTIQTYPNPTVSVYSGAGQGQEVQFVDNQQDGAVQYTDRYTDFSGASQTTTGTIDFGASGYASATGSTITIVLSQYVF